MKMLDVPQSGSIGGVTSSHNRAGQYKRNRRAPVSPTRTPNQGVARARFGTASALWNTLTAPLHAAWQAFAAGYPVVDSLGQSIVLTGQAYFVGIQSQLLAVGQATNTAVPVNTATPVVDTPALYIDATGAVIASVNSVVVGDFNKVSLSSVVSAGTFFNKQFTQFGVLTSTGLMADLSTVYAAKYGAPTLGRKVFANIVEVNSSGMRGSDTIFSATAVAGPGADPAALTNVVAGTVVSTGSFGTATSATLFSVDAVSGIAYGIQTQPIVAGAATFTAVPAGLTLYSRTQNGTVFSVQSNTITPSI